MCFTKNERAFIVQLLAHKRSRNRQVSVSGKSALPEALWLKDLQGHHPGSVKLARIRAKQEAQHLADAAMHQARLVRFCWTACR